MDTANNTFWVIAKHYGALHITDSYAIFYSTTEAWEFYAAIKNFYAVSEPELVVFSAVYAYKVSKLITF